MLDYGQKQEIKSNLISIGSILVFFALTGLLFIVLLWIGQRVLM